MNSVTFIEGLDRFPEEPDFEPIENGQFMLRRDWECPLPNGGKHVLKKGFTSDLMSIPRMAWSIVGLTPDGPQRGPAGVHDDNYGRGEIPRAEADAILKWMLEQVNVHMPGSFNWFQINAVYWAVRLFGGSHYGGK